MPVPVNAQASLDIAHHFANLPDPRHPAFRDRHRLCDILVIALSAILSGARSWDAIADFGVAKETWFRSLGLALPNGIPAHDTFNRLFAALDPLAFQQGFTSWINAVCRTLGFCHTVNDTGVSDRMLIAILDQYQQKDGSLKVPEVLQPLVGSEYLR